MSQSYDLVSRSVRVLFPDLFSTGLRLLVQVLADDTRRFSIGPQLAILQPDRSPAKTCDGLHIMRHKDHGPSRFADRAHFAETFLLEADIAHGQHFVDYQN